MPESKAKEKAPVGKSTPRRRGSLVRTYDDRKELRRDVKRQAVRDLKAVFGRNLPAYLWARPTTMSVPNVERSAQAAYARARGALRALLRAAPAGTVCGPCTAFVHEHRGAIETLTRDAEDGRGAHWRQHTAERTSTVARVVDTWGSVTWPIDGAKRTLTVRELACIALLQGAVPPPSASDVAACIDAIARQVRSALARK